MTEPHFYIITPATLCSCPNPQPDISQSHIPIKLNNLPDGYDYGWAMVYRCKCGNCFLENKKHKNVRLMPGNIDFAKV